MPTPLNSYRFTLDSTLQGTQLIDDPIGWEDITEQGNRDSNTHGLFFDISGTSFKFWGVAYNYLMTAFDTDGIEADVTVLIEETCDGGITFESFFTGQLDFTKKEQTIGMPCLFIAPVAQDGCLVKLQKKIDEKVVIPTDIPLEIPTKTVLKYARIEQQDGDNNSGEDNQGEFTNIGTQTHVFQKSVARIFTNNTVAQDDPLEIQNYHEIIEIDQLQSINPGIDGSCNSNSGATCADSIPTDIRLGQDKSLFVVPVNGDYTISWNFEGAANFIGFITGDRKVDTAICPTDTAFNDYRLEIKYNIYRNGTLIFDFNNIVDANDINCFSTVAGIGISTTTVAVGFSTQSSTYFPSGFVHSGLLAGDEINLFIVMVHGSTDYVGSSGAIVLRQWLYINEGSFFNIVSDDSVSNPPTSSDVCFIDTAFQTAVKNITDNCIDFKSLFFGRTDGINGGEASDGCGGLNVLTNGLKLRRVSPSTLFLSTKYLFDNLSAIYNLGMVVEIIGGNYFLRVEDVRYFYDPTILMTFDNVPDIKIKFDPQLAHNKLSIGYQTWESEGASGRDDMMTKREYGVPLTTIKGDISKYSDIIASSYAAEITRRESIASNDFKYDNNTFILLLKRTGGGGGYVVDQGNLSSPNNLVDFASGYNYNISPARNALRWFKTAFVAVKDYLTAPLMFKYGEGNYIAEGELTSGCSIETGIIKENQDITYSDMNAGEGNPLFSGETIDFEVPFTNIQSNSLKLSPNQLIGISSGTTNYIYGWVKSYSYKKKEKKAKFVLLKKL